MCARVDRMGRKCLPILFMVFDGFFNENFLLFVSFYLSPSHPLALCLFVSVFHHFLLPFRACPPNAANACQRMKRLLSGRTRDIPLHAHTHLLCAGSATRSAAAHHTLLKMPSVTHATLMHLGESSHSNVVNRLANED